VYLEWQAFYEKGHLVVANKGKRPITIKRIIVRAPEDGWAGFTVLDEDSPQPPVKLSFGDEVTFVLSDKVAPHVFQGEYELQVFDSEGNVYYPTLSREWSPRYEGYSKFKKIKKPTQGRNR